MADALVAAAALGFAVTNRAMEVWVGALSGWARASRELLGQQPDPVRLAKSVREPLTRASKSKKTRVSSGGRNAGVYTQLVSMTRGSKPTSVPRPEIVDDLKKISGVGPKLEQVLNGFGIWNYDQIASWSEVEAQWIDDALGLGGRVGNDNWLGQAKGLAQAKMQKNGVTPG
ncbi:MAG: hypothetical protein KF874_06940 [Rhizobiaceae bacterium]|nr:hypothetical protein [Rhizobiaceae bacterium]